MAKFCMFCGKELEDDARFCPKCGRSVDAEVKQEVVDKPFTGNKHEKEINQLREEIAANQRKRKVMVGWGIGLLVSSFVLLMVFTILFVMGVVRGAVRYEETDSYAFIESIVGIYLFYMIMILILALAMDGGIALIAVGSAVCSTRIRKRENRIRMLEKDE